LKPTAKKAPQEDSGYQLGERSKHLSPLKPDCKLTIHAGLPDHSPHTVVGRNKSESSVRGCVQHLIIALSGEMSNRFPDRKISWGRKNPHKLILDEV